MRCPRCDYDNVGGDELCVQCGQDLLDGGVPQPRGGMQGRILSDPVSALNPADPIIVASTASAAEAIKQMKEKRHGSVLVVDRGRLSGIFTERDLLLKVAGRDINLDSTPISALMTPEPVTLSDDDPLAHAIHLMAVRGLRHIPILRDGKPLGVVSIRGVLAYLTDQAP